ncbi:MAG: hypothetical protein ABFQ95_05150 [Pseudomonadota bacterium]
MAKQEQSNKLLAFVCDQESKNIIQSIALQRLGLETEAHLGDSGQAIDHLKSNRTPKIILVDISGVALPASEMQKLAEVCEPGVEVIAIGDRNEVGIFRSLMELGVGDYIAKPLNAELLVKSIERLLEDESTQVKTTHGFAHLGKGVTFIGARGGVGTSTILANCAATMATKHSKRVSIVDFDRQLGVQSRLFDLKPSSGLRELFESPDRLDPVFIDRSMTKYNDHLYILSTEEGLNENYTSSSKVNVSLLKILKNQFHYSFLDLPRHFMDEQNALLFQQTEIVVIVADLTILSMRDTVRILKLLTAAKKTSQRVLIVANRVNAYKEGELPQQAFEDAVERKIDHLIAFDAFKTLVALNMGQTIVEQGGLFAKGVENLVELLLGRDIPGGISKQGLINYFFTKKA